MNSTREYIIFILNFIRCIPHLFVYYFHKNKSIIKADVKNGLKLRNKNYGCLKGLIYLFSFNRAFRNIFYYRVQPFDFFLKLLCPELSTLHIGTEKIGPGFAISWGFATAIGARSIGKNFTVFQQVTLGAATSSGLPAILDNVTVYAGAIIVGHVTIGNNVVIGANATVFKDVPDNCTVLPSFSRVIRWNKEAQKNRCE